MLWGLLPHALPQFTLSGEILKFRDVVRHVGIFFQSTHYNIFASHYTKKHDAAVGTARAITGCDLLIGNHCMPPAITKQLYTAPVDCHLTHGCEIMPNTDPNLLRILEDVQIHFLRRMLGLSINSVITPLCTETGIMPICMHRVALTLRYLKYLIGLPDTHYASLALKENNNLRSSGFPCWLSDLDYTIAQLPGNHRLPPLQHLNGHHIDKLINTIVFSTKTDLQSHIDMWSKLSLLQHRLEPNDEGPAKPLLIGLRHYLTQVTNHSHRRCITKLLCGNYIPNMFRASPSPLRQLTATEHANRLCRACKSHPETPQHVLLQFPSLNSISCLQADFISGIRHARPLPLNAVFSDSTALHYLKSFIFDWVLITSTSKFIHDTVDRWQSFLDTGFDSEGVAESESELSNVE
ncbi:hypothetical protein EV368DRAFT_85633 [Lentinula lateritia]|uniref:Uncharacterized protein n=1 Tax=Lentinula aff. lateritia TaxID=2804960 RepID=A0ACC1TIF6_9AGAR|nr:hypothetical protein F5876DRAFT_83401 [Lentinula aff. lateritia]KAJ3849347.1 hypothetical protein EV368DRAFT_85633 [Lentinula lateritia]